MCERNNSNSFQGDFIKCSGLIAHCTRKTTGHITQTGCCIGGTMINILCFADDMVLLAPSWNALQFLIDVLYNAASSLHMKFNTNLHDF